MIKDGGIEMSDAAERIVASLANLDFVHDMDAESGEFWASSVERGSGLLG
jgi:hypothetical protein